MANQVIETRGLTRRFGDVLAVDDLALSVPQGGVYGFLGPNGAGKTTTIRMLLGLIRPDAGQVALFGRPLYPNRLALLRRVGALVERPSLYPHLTGRENLEVTRRIVDATQAQRDRALHLVHLEDAADRLVKTYSTGMQQRLALALALMPAPELLILDEPTNGLDPAGIREMRELITSLPGELGISIFLSSHLLSEVEQVATHIGIIQAGRLRFQGTLDALHAQTARQLSLEANPPGRARQLLRDAGWAVRGNGGQRMEVVVNGPADAALINAQLVHGGVGVSHLALARPTLEDIFLTLTGAPGVSAAR
jgi:ABC-type multidrug transport system ATPase subunit